MITIIICNDRPGLRLRGPRDNGDGYGKRDSLHHPPEAISETEASIHHPLWVVVMVYNRSSHRSIRSAGTPTPAGRNHEAKITRLRLEVDNS